MQGVRGGASSAGAPRPWSGAAQAALSGEMPLKTIELVIVRVIMADHYAKSAP